MATKDVAKTTGDAVETQSEIITAAETRMSPDGQSVAIRTIFEDTSPGQVSSWLAVDVRGIATYMTQPQVEDWIRG